MSGKIRLAKLTILFLVLPGILNAQAPDEHVVIQSPVTSNQTVYALKSITLLPGAHIPSGVTFKTVLYTGGYTEYTGTDTDIKNWTESKAFGINGNVVAHGKSYFDLMGKAVQSQAANLTDGKAVVSQTVYDAFGRPVISTLPAAITNADLAYKTGFITNHTGDDYSHEDFDGTKLNTPEPVNSGILNALGWYYSNDNTTEAHVPASAYPYTRIEYSKITGQARHIAMAGEYHKMGTHNAMSFTMPAAENELKNYSLTYFSGELEYIGLTKTINIDAMGKETIAYRNSDGNIVATCMTGTSIGIPLAVFMSELLITGVNYIDIHKPSGTPNHLMIPTEFKVYDLVTDALVAEGSGPQSITLPSGYYRVIYNNTGPDNGSTFSYYLNYDHFSFNIYDKAGRLTESYSPKAVENAIAGGTPVPTTYTYNALSWLVETTSPDQGTTQYVYRRDGSIRFSQNAQQAIDGTFSYTNYDDAGRIIEVGEFVETATITFSPGMDPTTYLTPAANCQDVSTTYYDIPYDGYDQQFVTGAVSKTENDHVTTWYSYTYDGKIKWVLMDITGVGIKTIDYEYDFNGNVARVIYEKENLKERFDHQYQYDQDLRLSKVLTYESDGLGIPKSGKIQARYHYYAHGPLKRIEIGNDENTGNRLQGIDYVYNINGWLKGMNHPSLLATEDPGGDSDDLFGMSLDYYSGDYTRVGVNYATTTGNERYDGNIKAQHWQTRTSDAGMDPGTNSQWLNTYTYNNLNYLNTANFGTFNRSGNTASTAAMVDNVSYDANGNILTLNRHANGNNFDKFTYSYPSTGKPNQLSSLADAATNYGYQDIQGTESFTYDNIGQMTGRTSAYNEQYVYDVYGKVKSISYDGSPKAEYFYDDKGFRVKKKVYISASAYDETWYVRDASGNILSIYTSSNGGTIAQTELPVYGSGRIGTKKKTDIYEYQYEYELTDHLGNVRVTFADDGAGNATLKNYADYMPFGMHIPNRYKSDGKYRFGYQGQFAEDETDETGYNAFEARLWDSRIGRWTTIDPAGQFFSPYLGMGNNPISFVDPDGRTIIPVGSDDFVRTMWSYINKISATSLGKEVINVLMDPNITVYIKEEGTKRKYPYYDAGVVYKNKLGVKGLKENIEHGMNLEWWTVIGHELYHAYQATFTDFELVDDIIKETEAVAFENYLSSCYGRTRVRTAYSGIPVWLEATAETFNPLGERIYFYPSDELPSIDTRLIGTTLYKVTRSVITTWEDVKWRRAWKF